MMIKDQLRSTRARAGMTQERVAQAAGMHVTQYNGYETGRAGPLPNTLARIAAALGVSVEELTTKSGVTNAGAAYETPEQIDWDNAREALQALTAERLGIDADRVCVDVHIV